MTRLHHLLGPLVLGGLHGLCYAPGLFPGAALPWLQLLLLTGIAYLLWGQSRLIPAWPRGFAFVLRALPTRTSWIYISLHEFAYMAALLALSAVIVLAMFLSLFYAVATSLSRHFFPQPTRTPWRTVLSFAGIWAALEWLRGNLFTGFPWLNIGYAHVDGPLQGWAPLLGVYGLALAAALTAATIAMWLLCRKTGPRAHWLLVLPALLLGVGTLSSA